MHILWAQITVVILTLIITNAQVPDTLDKAGESKLKPWRHLDAYDITLFKKDIEDQILLKNNSRHDFFKSARTKEVDATTKESHFEIEDIPRTSYAIIYSASEEPGTSYAIIKSATEEPGTSYAIIHSATEEPGTSYAIINSKTEAVPEVSGDSTTPTNDNSDKDVGSESNIVFNIGRVIKFMSWLVSPKVTPLVFSHKSSSPLPTTTTKVPKYEEKENSTENADIFYPICEYPPCTFHLCPNPCTCPKFCYKSLTPPCTCCPPCLEN